MTASHLRALTSDLSTRIIPPKVDRMSSLLRTDESGHVLFQAQYGRVCFLQRLYYTVSSAEAGVHASFGQHAFVFAFGGGYEEYALAGRYLIDWRGTPVSMQSRIVVKKTGT